MFYDAELSFLQKILSDFRLKSVIKTDNICDISELDMEIRKLLGFEEEYKQSLADLKDKMKPNTIYKFIDVFHCVYIFMLLPDTSPVSSFVIGPYTTVEMNRDVLMKFTEKYAISSQSFYTLQQYFSNIPFLQTDTPLFMLLNILGEKMWKEMGKFCFETVEQDINPNAVTGTGLGISFENTDALISTQELEERYDTENKFLKAVSLGLSYKAELIMGDLDISHYEKRNLDPIRNIQNYSIIMNTLLRKAAEQGGVHPLYIDRISSDFGRKIEAITSVEGGTKLQREMIRKYCLLVKNHSMKGYSLLVQKIITAIDSDLTADLSLNAMSEFLNVNASYLSTLFKKETGNTLTDYVNRRRIEHSILLLNSTTLQIQTIAQYCGIPDVNYFSKMFKKRIGKTPKEYRDDFINGTE